ncbi:alpha/beta-hydrolase [Biscogniauxia mediterranea]|nr:alpha/beta-hydrolase [Biscogniauxia mediterranea]
MKIYKSLLVLAAYGATTALSQNTTNTTNPETFPLSTDEYFSFFFHEMLALSNGGGAATGEILRAASQITPGDFESVYTEFKFLADSLHSVAASINATRYPVSSREAYFRAASYYRASVFFLIGNQTDTRLFDIWDIARADFDAAMALLDVPGERVTIKGPGFDIPIIFWKADRHDGTPAPTLLLGSGYDAPQEETYHQLGREVLSRGWNLVTYEGPGQPSVRREQGLGFISDWWTVVTPVVDYLTSERGTEVDARRIALGGLSFGGTLAPLAASREHRIAATVAIEGLYSLQQGTLAQFPAAVAALFNSGNRTAFDAYLNAARASPSVSSQFRWFVDQGLWAFATQSPFDWFTRLGDVSLSPEILANITCPVFVGRGQIDETAPGQERQVADLLGDRAHYHEFEQALGAGEHCQLGAEPQLAQAVMDWLGDVFEKIE